MTALATFLAHVLERILSAVCHIDGHIVETHSGACMRCRTQIFTPPKESR